MVSGKDFPGCPLVKILGFHCMGKGSITGQGTPISCAQQEKKKGFCWGQTLLRTIEYSGMFQNSSFSLPSARSMSKFFAYLYCENLLELQETKVVKVWEPTSDQVPLEF